MPRAKPRTESPSPQRAASATPDSTARPGWQRDLPWLLLILALGAGLRVAYLAELRQTPDFVEPLADAGYHDYWARGLVTGDWTPPAGEPDPQIRSVPYQRPPGYTWFLAAIYGTTVAERGTGYVAVRVVQTGLGLASAVLAYLVGRRTFGRGVGLIAAAWLALHWAFIYYEGELQEPVLLVFLGLAAVLALAHWSERPALWGACVVGLLLGLLAIIRPNGLVLLPLAGLWMLWVLWRRGRLRRAPGAMVAFGLAAAVIIAPVTVRNWGVAREFVLISSNGAINLYIGNNPRADGYSARIPELPQLTGRTTWSWFIYPEIVAGVSRELGRAATHADVGAYFRDQALAYIRAHPAAAAGLALKRTLLFWGPAVVANNKEVHCERQASAVLRWLPGFPVVVGLTLAGVLLARFARVPPGMAEHVPRAGAAEPPFAAAATAAPAAASTCDIVVLLAAFVLAWFLSFVPFLAAERFRVPVAAWLAVPAAWALVRIATLIGARPQAGLAWAGATVGLLLLVHVPVAPFVPQPAAYYMGRGDAWAARGDLGRAADEYQRAVAARPDYDVARQALAGVLLKLGRPHDAVAQQRALVAANPQSAAAQSELARALLEARQITEAEKLARAALGLDPTLAAAHVTLGNVLAERGQLADAVAAYETALRLEPGNADAHYNLGLARLGQGALEAAGASFEAAANANPRFIEARINHGVTLAQRGRHAEAIGQYRAALAIDPRRFEAHFALAQSLAAGGKLEEALRAARAALAVQPDNAQAADLLRRLEQQGRGP